jgi:hypothetical protein
LIDSRMKHAAAITKWAVCEYHRRILICRYVCYRNTRTRFFS